MAFKKSDGYAAVERPAIVIVINSVGRGRFRARLDGCVIVAASAQPFLDSARILIAKGCDPGAVLEMRRAGSTAFDLRGPLRVAARLELKEGPLRFVRHQDGPETRPGALPVASNAGAWLGEPPNPHATGDAPGRE